MGALARRPAPLQVMLGVGYPGTTGATFVDYYVGDRGIVPPQYADGCSERLVLLPATYQVPNAGWFTSRTASPRLDSSSPTGPR